ncbi:hypothetical protein D3C85_1001970 [compost metagenome]
MLPEPISRMSCLRRLASAWPTRFCSSGPCRLGSDTWTTGISAFGYISESGTHAPWSKGRCESRWAGSPAWLSSAATSVASSGSPAAGYCTANNSAGKPPKSCQVSGFGWLATSSSWLSQWAETITMAFGLGSSAASRASAGPLAPGCRASMGEPWEMNRLGSMVGVLGVKMGPSSVR